MNKAVSQQSLSSQGSQADILPRTARALFDYNVSMLRDLCCVYSCYHEPHLISIMCMSSVFFPDQITFLLVHYNVAQLAVSQLHAYINVSVGSYLAGAEHP